MKGWLNTRLGKEIDLKTGFPFKSAQYSDELTDIRLLRGDNIVQGKLRWDDVQRWPKEDVDAYKDYLLAEGDVVLAMDRPWIEAGLKYACLSKDDVPCLQVQRTARLRGKGRLRTDYLRYIIAGERFTRYVKQVNTGSNVPHISAAQIRDFQVLIPPPDDQKRIAKVLFVLDAKIDLNNRINKELEGLAKVLYDYWFVQFDFPITAAQAAAMGKPHLKGKPYRASGGKMIYNEVLKREIPIGWEGGNILAIAELGGGATPSKKIPEFWGGDIPFFTPTDAKSEPFCLDTEDHITQRGLGNGATRLYSQGTLFITARGSVGKAMIISRAMAMNQSCYALCPRNGVGSAFLYFHTLSLMDYLHAKSSGSVFNSIVTNDINFTPAVVPASQQLTTFNEVAEPMFKSILTHQEQNLQLTELRDWLLPMLMNGQVTVG